MIILVQFDENRKVIAQRRDRDVILEEWTDLSDHPDGPNFMGRIYDEGTDTFGPPQPLPPKTRRLLLKEKKTWTVADRNEAIRILL